MVYYILAGYIVLILLAFIIQDRFIWKPEKLHPDFTFRYDQPFEELFFDPEPGVRLNGLHFKVPEPRGCSCIFMATPAVSRAGANMPVITRSMATMC